MRALNPLTIGFLFVGAALIVGAGPLLAALPLLIGCAALLWRQQPAARRRVLVVGAVVALLIALDVVIGGPIGRLAVLAARFVGLGLTAWLAISLVDRRDFVRDLERRGASRAVAFRVLLLAELAASTRDRVPAIGAAQRARGAAIDTGLVARWRGRLVVIGPLVAGVVRDVDERTFALEARGFHRPGSRDLPWAPADSNGQRIIRFGVLLVAIAIVLVSPLAGVP